MSNHSLSRTLLTTADHSRDAAGLRYVYPVVSRRAGGVSIGINLNTNNACNWRCVYCQVPELLRGDAPAVDLTLLRKELSGFVAELQQGSFMRERVPEEVRQIVDVALSGNGEPTSAGEFDEVIELVAHTLAEHRLLGTIPIRLITNGSRIRRAPVRAGLRRLAQCNGEVWFKLDAGTPEVLRRINGVSVSHASVVRNLRECASLCPTWVQTCAFAWGEIIWLRDDLDAYVALLREAGSDRLRGVLLYSLARPSMQPQARELRRLTAEELESIAGTIRTLGLPVTVTP